MTWSPAAAVSGLGRRLRSAALLLLLVAVFALLAAGALWIAFRPPAALGRPEPLPVAANDREIVWLYAATNNASWERFVAALLKTGDRLRADYPDLEIQDAAAFPPQTTATPEIALLWKTSGRRLVFRWYKLTSKQKTADWVDALMRRQPPPLAIIGGSTSDAARDLATQMHAAAESLPPDKRPLLLLTTATADEIIERVEMGPDLVARAEGAPAVRLHQLYPDRTFRFCFTNKQMAAAVTRFIWQHDELRPDSDPVHVVRWDDDAYSRDLAEGFWRALQVVSVESAAVEWAWALGCCLRAGSPPDLGCAIVPYQRLGAGGSAFRMAAVQTGGELRAGGDLLIDSSVGSFDAPNRMEAKAAVYLLKSIEDHPNQRRPLLVVTGQAQPARRFLRAFERNAPERARACVVVTGDSIAFNTVYRDGKVAWPIQDLPYRLVFFCHHNPTDTDAGFHAAEEVRETGDGPGPTTTTGTEDLLLFGDIVAALALCYNRDGRPCADATELGDRFHDLRLYEGRLGFAPPPGRPLFNKDGNRHSGTGEHIVYLTPEYQGPRVLPRAVIEVWSWRTEGIGETAESRWERYGRPLEVRYDGTERQGVAP